MKQKIVLAVLLVAAIVAGRMLPHAANFTPVASVLLLSAAYLNRKYALGILLAGMVLSDALIGFYNPYGMICNYVGLAAVLLATFMPGLKAGGLKNAGWVAMASVTGSLLFYVVSNFGVWAFSGMYSHNVAGLEYCYLMALPFLRNTLTGDLFYNVLFFGGAYALQMLSGKFMPAMAGK